MTLLVVLILFALLAALAPKFGVDTRERGEWAYRPVDNRNPLQL